MNQNSEIIDKYFGLNSVRSEQKQSLPDKKRPVSYRVSDKELRENIFYWDSSIRQFIKVQR